MVSAILVAFAFHAILTATARGETRAFLGVLLFVHFYFCIAGWYYWVVYRDAYFVGVYWDPELVTRSALVISLSTTGVALVAFLFDRRVSRMATARPDAPIEDAPIPRPVWLIFALGLVCSLFSLAYGSFGEVGADRGPLFLIAYQLSDLLVPALLYFIARRGLNWRTKALFLYFVVFAVLVGFRYKIALLAIPLFVELMLRPIPFRRKLGIGLPFAVGILALFSLMTLYRSKFGVPDLTKPLMDPWAQLTFGAFAEANILFGMTSVMVMFVDRGEWVYFETFIQGILDLVPRILWPNRGETSAFWEVFLDGMQTADGATSNTAHPFVGEYAAAFGWPGIVLGTIFFGLLYVFLHRCVVATAPTDKLRRFGTGIVIGMMAYYHYTRGYTPQALKGYLFFVAPYIYFCYLDTKAKLRARSRPSSRPLRYSAARAAVATR